MERKNCLVGVMNEFCHEAEALGGIFIRSLDPLELESRVCGAAAAGVVHLFDAQQER